MTSEQEPKLITPRTFEIQEMAVPRSREAHFASYRDAQQAILELIDNAVDNRIEGKPLTVRIRVNRNEIAVSNQSGKGLTQEGLKKFFVWGYSEKTSQEIGFYGVGGKAAMGYLGRSMEVVCSPGGSAEEYRVVDPDWKSSDEEWKNHTGEIRSAANKEGYFRVKIGDLEKEVNAAALAARLANIYRPLLLEKKVLLFVNSKAIEPMEIKYEQDLPNFQQQAFTIQTRFGNDIEMIVGLLSPGQRVNPGIRCYYRGRLIEDGEFFGHPTPAQLPQASRLIGEAHLDFVPVMSNKANFIRNSLFWEHASLRIHGVLMPWYDKLAKFKIESTTPVENWEKEAAKSAKRILEHIFATTGILTKDLLPGQSGGRLEGSPQLTPRKPKRKTHKTPRPTEGVTAPTLDATIGTESIKRWGAFHSWEVVPMGSSDKRSAVVNESGRQVLKINSSHSLYQAEKKIGSEAVELYIAETGILQIAEVVSKGKSIDEFIDLINSLSSELGSRYQNRLASGRRKA